MVQSWFGPCMCVCRPSCAAPAATPGTRKRCSPSASTCSATNVSRCVTTPDRGSAPSATVPSAPTTSTASTSPNPPSGGRRQQTEPKRGAGWREASGTEEIFNEAHTLGVGGGGCLRWDPSPEKTRAAWVSLPRTTVCPGSRWRCE